jgi:putative ABC transport system permease protein
VIFLRNLLRAKIRAVMTMVGVAGGIAVFVAITSMTADLRSQISGLISTYSTDIIVQDRKAATPYSSKLSISQLEELQEHFDQKVSPLVLGSLRETWNPYAFLVGAPQSLAGRIPMIEGKAFKAGQKEIMLGSLCASKLNLGTGQELNLGNQSYTITGVFRSGSRLLDGGIMTSLLEAQHLLSKIDSFSLALVQTVNPEQSRRGIEQINQNFPDLRAQLSIEFAGSLRVFKLVEIIARTVSIIALIGACIIVTNTLFMALYERTRDIGILMAIGWNPVMILRILLAESLAICLLGALLGNGLGVALLWGLNRIKSVGFGWIPVQLTLSTFISSLSVAMALGFLALIWPAIILLRIQPATALRHE